MFDVSQEDLQWLDELNDEWLVLIVADLKRAKNYTCKKCKYLIVEEQLRLNYNVLPLLSLDGYISRKIIGYLYAIENGAKFIYNTDEDNKQIKSKLDLFDYSSITTSLSPSPPILLFGWSTPMPILVDRVCDPDGFFCNSSMTLIRMNMIFSYVTH